MCATWLLSVHYVCKMLDNLQQNCSSKELHINPSFDPQNGLEKWTQVNSFDQWYLNSTLFSSQISTYLSPFTRYFISPGGRVEGVNVLLTAAVILLMLPNDSSDVTSASNGKWPPECVITSLPFSHWKYIKKQNNMVLEWSIDHVSHS